MTTTDVRERTWTKEEYYRLGELGFFRGQRVELMQGQLMVMCPQGFLHGNSIQRATAVLTAMLPVGFLLRAQLPLDLGAMTEPEPDFSVVTGTLNNLPQGHATHALLVVEISDSTLAYDRGRKASLYASAGILDYWIINLVTPQVEIYRDPVADTAAPFGHRYSQRVDHMPGAILTPLALPNSTVAVADLLP